MGKDISLRRTLLCFEAISGLKLNFAKSELVPVEEVQAVVELTHVVGCKISKFIALHFLLRLCLSVCVMSKFP